MKKFKLFFVPVLVGLFAFYGCSEDDPAVNEAEVLIQYLESADSPYGGDYANTATPTIIKSTDVHNDVITNADNYIIDLRSATDFAAGHIEGAHNVKDTDVLTHVQGAGLAKDAKITIVCYTGQTAGWATALMNLAGYKGTKSMKWGMSSWHTDFSAKWDNNIGNSRATQFTTDATAKPEAGSLPALSTGKTTGAEIFEARLAAVFAEGFAAAKTSNGDVFDNAADYQVANYWKVEHYDDPGHIPGAIQYTPKKAFMLAEDLKTLATDKKIAVYCYTGQTSAHMAAYLRLIGYDAKSIVFGTNGMIYDDCVEAGMTVWNEAQKHEYDYVTD